MKRILAAAIALMQWALPVWATTTAMGPGGGGTFNCSATSGLSAGRVLLGSDNAGMFGRNGSSGNWTRIGSQAGLYSNNVASIAFSRKNPKRVICGAGNGVYYSTDTGQNWSLSTLKNASGNDIDWGYPANGSNSRVTAVAWGWANDSNVCVMSMNGYAGASTKAVHIGVSEDGGATFKLYASIGITTDATNERIPIKIALDPLSDQGSRDIYVLFGCDHSDGNTREIWRNQTNGSGGFSLITGGAGQPAYPIDMTFYKNLNRMIVSSSDDAGDPSDVVTGETWWFDAINSGTWHKITGSTISNLTGAVWSDGTFEYLINIGADIGESGSGTNCSSASLAAGGLWKRHGGDSVSVTPYVWQHMDPASGSTSSSWEVGWTVCPRARGALNNAVAKSLSLPIYDIGTPDGPYWGTQSFVWRYNGSKFVREFTDLDKAGTSGPYNTTLADNANAVTEEFDNTYQYLWAGYYDLGLWKYTGSGWENHNDTEWGWDGYGGNVSGIVFDWTGSPDTVYVLAAGSSKDNDWKLYRSTSSGAYDTWSAYGNLPKKGDGGWTGGVFLNSLTKDPVGTSRKLWVTLLGVDGSSGTIYSSSDASTWTAASGLPAGMMVVRAYNGTVLGGGWGGLYRYHGSSWSQVSSIIAPSPASDGPSNGENHKTHLHRHLWNGVQDIYYDVLTGYWYVTCYAQSGGLTSGSRGVWRSTDDGLSFSLFGGSGGDLDKNLLRAVSVDSCGYRIHVTSGRGFSSPVNGSSDLSAAGLVTCRWNGSTVACRGQVTNDGVWGYYQAHAIREIPDDTYLYVLSPGYGVHKVSLEANGVGCTELQGDGMSARPAVEEASAEVRQTIFTVREARVRTDLYDLSGRRAKPEHTGVYFMLKKNKAGAIIDRRTVVVTP